MGEGPTEDQHPRDAPNSLDEFLADLLPEIDDFLATQGTPLSQRPMRAASFVVEHCIVSVDGKSTDGFQVKGWFGVLLSLVIEWYERLYGDAISAQPKKTHTAVLLIRNTPTALEIPLSFFSPLAEDNTRWFTFASDVLPHEEPLSWLVRPPTLSLLTEAQAKEISAEVTETAVNIRRCSIGVLTISKDHPLSMRHGSLVLQYLERAAQNILSNERRNLSTAVWDANFAAEQAVKCYLHQAQSVEVPNKHDVRKLAMLAAAEHTPQGVTVALEKMPSGADAIGYRYGEISTPSLSMVLSIYRAALVICRYYLNAYPRSIRLDNARFQLKFPPMPSNITRSKSD